MNLSNADKSRVLEELENCRLDHERQATLFEGYTKGKWHKADAAELAGLIERVREAFEQGGGE